MRKATLAVLTAFALGASPVAARQSISDCEAIWKTVVGLLGEMTITSPGRMSVASEGCLLRDLGMEQGSDYGMRLKVRSVAFDGTGLERIAENLPPTALFLEIKGLQVSAKAGDAAFSYLLMAQNARSATDLIVRAHWDEASKTVFLDQFDADFWGDNSIKVSAAIADLDLSTADTILLSAGGAAMTKLDAEIVSNGLFEAYMLIPVGQRLFYELGAEPGKDDPETFFERSIAAAIDGLNQVSEKVLPAASRQALQTMLAELPNPAGKLVLQMAANPGIGPGTFARAAISGVPKTVAEAAGYLDGAVFDITYTPTPPE